MSQLDIVITEVDMIGIFLNVEIGVDMGSERKLEFSLRFA